MAVFSTIGDIAYHLVDPWLFIALSLRYLPQTILQIVGAKEFRSFFSPSAFKEKWFGNFWAFIGPQVKSSGEKRVIPLLQGRVRDGQVFDHVVNQPVSGIVLEVGAGSGMWADVFAKIDVSAAAADANDGHDDERNGEVRMRKGGLRKVYGIEPNPQSAAALRQRVKDVGLEGTYEVVPVGIESLNDPSAWSGRIEPGSVDCAVTILCLCSIPEPEKNVKLLYDCLKKGGRWYAYEHVQVERGGLLLRIYQHFTNMVWSQLMGSCRICRASGKTLRDVGPWETIDLEQPPDEPAYQVLPHIYGMLTK